MSIIVTFPWSFLHLQTSPSSKQFEDAKNELRNVTSVCVFIASLLETVVHNQLICRFIFADFYPRIEDIWSGFQTCQNYLQLKRFSPTNHSGWHSRENPKPSHHKKAFYCTDKATRIQYFAIHTQDSYLGSKLLHMSLPSRHLLAPYDLRYLLIFNDKGTRARSNRFPTHCSGIFIVDCEQVNAS